MAKKVAKKPEEPGLPGRPAWAYGPSTFESFLPPGWTFFQNKQGEPSVWNGEVRVQRFCYKVELVEEPVEIIHERLKKLWRESDHFHHCEPLRAVAKRFGLELKDGFGKDRKRGS